MYYGLKLTDGASGVPAVEHEIIRAVPQAVNASFHLTSTVEGQVNRTVEPESIALAVFGIIAALAAVLIAAQVAARQIQQAGAETAMLRALGASRLAIMADVLIGILGAIVAGSLLAAGVAIALSPLSPIGPVRPVYPAPGPAADLTVLDHDPDVAAWTGVSFADLENRWPGRPGYHHRRRRTGQPADPCRAPARQHQADRPRRADPS